MPLMPRSDPRSISLNVPTDDLIPLNIPALSRCADLLFQQINIIDDGCQRCLDIVGNVCDQFCLKPFTLHPLLDRMRHAITDVIDLLSLFLKYTGHMLCTDLIARLAACNFFRSGF